ncbi:hypothetical protein Bca101_052446 [Brassica carinata]
MFTRKITSKDVKAIEKNRIRYSSKHIKHLLPGTVTEFEWKDYCPLGFKLVQELDSGKEIIYETVNLEGSVDSNSSKLMKTASNSPDRSSTMYSFTPSRGDSLDCENSVVESVASIRPSPSPTKASDSSQGSIASIPKITDIFQNSSSTNFGMKIPGRARRVERGGSGSVVGKNIREEEEWSDVIFYLGIIDIFQDYGVRKRIEHCYKSIQHSSKTISAVHPKTYSSRFQDFVSQICLPEEDHPSHSY